MLAVLKIFLHAVPQNHDLILVAHRFWSAFESPRAITPDTHRPSASLIILHLGFKLIYRPVLYPDRPRICLPAVWIMLGSQSLRREVKINAGDIAAQRPGGLIAVAALKITTDQPASSSAMQA